MMHEVRFVGRIEVIVETVELSTYPQSHSHGLFSWLRSIIHNGMTTFVPSDCLCRFYLFKGLTSHPALLKKIPAPVGF